MKLLLYCTKSKWQLFRDIITGKWLIDKIKNRNRCFMVSILGEYSYNFPKKQKLKLRLKDLLEKDVDEKYYLSSKQIEDVSKWNSYEKPLENMDKMEKNDVATTLTTRSGAYAAGMQLVRVEKIAVKNNTKKGYLLAEEGDGIDISGRMETHRGTVQKGLIQTLDTQCNQGVVVVGNCFPNGHNAGRIIDSNGIAPIVMGNHDSVTSILDKDNYIQWQEKGRLDIDCRAYKEDKIAPTTTTPKTKIINNLRIRKLTPLECWRLMGVKDEDYEKVKTHQSESSLYHLAGDSIVVNVLMEIFKMLLKEEK